MLFSSITFLYYFLPLLSIVYFIANNKLKNSILLIASLIFYAWGEPKYVCIMIFSIISSFYYGIYIEKYIDKWQSKCILILSIVSGIGLLFYFKYIDFVILNINQFFGLQIALLKLQLPIGISFFTFQIISYTIDVYRKDVKASRNILNYATYVSLFPQLIAGPIVRYIDVEKEIISRKHSAKQVYDGLCVFMIGLSKKVLIANVLGQLFIDFKAVNEASVLFYWLYAIAFMLHIYFDFSGYSNMAIGLGKMFGFHFMENFNYPYIASSITDFWRRWHISLSQWFKDYVYIPLGGNRKGLKRTLINITIVWSLTGLWHGAAYTFILWGMLFALLLIMEKLFLLKYLSNVPSCIRHVYTLFFVMLSFILFDASSVTQAIQNISGLFMFQHIDMYNTESIYYLQSYWFVLCVAIIGATPCVKNMYIKMKGYPIMSYIELLIIIILLFVCSAYLVDGSFNPFLYFRF